MTDVAKAAGVSLSTVSRTLARPNRVAAATAEHVRRVAADLGYRVPPRGAALHADRSLRLALVVSDVTNPFYIEIIRGAQLAAAEAGCVLFVIDAQESGQLEREGLARVIPAVGGVILAGTRLSDSVIALTASQCPLAVINRDVANVPCILLDNAHGMRAIAEHLSRLGHHSLTYVAGPETSSADGVRWRSLRDAARGFGCDALRSGPCAPTVPGGWEAAAALPEVLPSALVAYNDQIATGLMLALHRRGVRVPQDVSIVGFDNIASTQTVAPPLTTVAAPLREQGRAAVDAVRARRENIPAAPGKRLTLPVRLVVRGSTGAPSMNDACRA